MANDKFTLEFDDGALNKFFSTLDKIKVGLTEVNEALNKVQATATNIDFKITGINNLNSLFKAVNGFNADLGNFDKLVTVAQKIKDATSILSNLPSVENLGAVSLAVSRLSESLGSGSFEKDVDFVRIGKIFAGLSGMFKGISLAITFIPGDDQLNLLTLALQRIGTALFNMTRVANATEDVAVLNRLTRTVPGIFTGMVGVFKSVALVASVVPGNNQLDLLTTAFARLGEALLNLSKAFGRDILSNFKNLLLFGAIVPAVFTGLVTTFKVVSLISSLVPGSDELDLLTKSFSRLGRAFLTLSQSFGKSFLDNIRQLIVLGVVVPQVFTNLVVVFKLVSLISSLIPGSGELDLLGQAFRRIGDAFKSLSLSFGDGLLANLRQVIVLGVLAPVIFTGLATTFRVISLISSIAPGSAELERLGEAFKNIGDAFRNLAEAFTGGRFNIKNVLQQVFVLGFVAPTIFTILAVTFRGVSALLSALPGGNAFERMGQAFKDFGDGMKKLSELKDLNLLSLVKVVFTIGILARSLKNITKDLVSLDIVDEFSSVAQGYANFGDGAKKIITATKDVKFTQLIGIFFKLKILGAAIKNLLNVGVSGDDAEKFGRLILNVGQGVKNLGDAFKDAKETGSLGIGTLIITTIKLRFFFSNLLKAVKGVTESRLEGTAKIFRALGDTIKAIFEAFALKVVADSKIKNILSVKDKVKIVKDIFKEMEKFKGASLPDISGFTGALPDILRAIKQVSDDGLDTGAARESVKDIVKIINEFSNLNVNAKNIEHLDKIAAAIREVNKVRKELQKQKSIKSGDIVDNDTKHIPETFGQAVTIGILGQFGGDFITDLRRALENALTSAFKAVNPIAIIRRFLDFGNSVTDFIGGGLGKLNELRDKVREVADNIKDIGENIRDFGERLIQFGPQALFQSDAFASAIDFDRVGTQLQVFGGLTDEARAQAEAFSFEIGRAYPLSANEALSATLDLIKAGQDLSSVEFILPSAADLAALSDSGDLDNATGILIAAQAQFAEFGVGIEGTFENIDVAANIISGAADLSTASVESLGQGLANVGPSASAFGLSLQDTAAILAIFDQNAISGAEGGTALRSVLNALSRPQTTQALRNLGISMFELNDSGQQVRRDFQDVINDIIVSLDGMDEAQRSATLQRLADTFGRQGLQVLLDQGVDGIDNFVAQLDEVAPASERAQQLLDNLAGDVIQLEGSFETLITRALLPLINTIARPFIQFLRLVVDALLTVNDETLAFVSTAIALGSIFLGALGAIAIVGGSILQLGGILAGVALTLLNIGAVITTVVAGVLAFGAALLTIAVVLPIIIGLVGGITYIFRGLNQAFANLQENRPDIFARIGRDLQSIQSVAGSIVREIGRIVQVFASMVVVDEAASSISGFELVITTLAGIVTNVTGTIVSFSRDALFALRAFTDFLTGEESFADLENNAVFRLLLGNNVNASSVSALFSRIRADVLQVMAAFNSLASAARSILGGLFYGNDTVFNLGLRTLQGGFANLSSGLVGIIGELFNIDTSQLEASLENSLGGTLRDVVVNLFNGMVTYLLDNSDIIVNGITTLLTQFVFPSNVISSILGFLGLEQLRASFDSFVEFLSEAISGTLNTIFNLLRGQSITEALLNAFGDNIQPAIGVVTGVIRTLRNLFGILTTIFSGLFLTPQQENESETGTTIFDVIGSVLTKASGAIEGLNTLILEPLRNFLGRINFDALNASLSQIFTGLGTAFQALANGEFGNILSGLSSAGLGVRGFLNVLKDALFPNGIDPSQFTVLAQQIALNLAVGLANAITNIGGTLAGLVGLDAATFVTNLVSLFQPVVDSLQAGDALAIFNSLATAISGTILSAILLAIAGTEEITGLDFSGVVTAITTAIEALVNTGEGNAFSSVGTAIAGVLAAAINLSIAGIGELLNIDVTTVTDIVNGELQETIDAIVNTFTDENGDSIFTNITDIITGIVDSITSLFDLGGGGGSLPDFSGLSVLGVFVGHIAALPLNIIQAALTAISTFVDALAEVDSATLTTTIGVIGAIVVTLGGFSAISGVSAAIPAITTALSGLYATLLPFLGLAAALVIVTAILRNLDEFREIGESLSAGDFSQAIVDFLDAIVNVFVDVGVMAGNTLFGLFGIDLNADKDEVLATIYLLTNGIILAFRAAGRSIGNFFENLRADLNLARLRAQNAFNFTNNDFARLDEVLADGFNLDTLFSQDFDRTNLVAFADAHAREFLDAMNARMAELAASGLTPAEIALDPTLREGALVAAEGGFLDRFINDLFLNGQNEVAIEFIPQLIPDLTQSNINGIFQTLDFQSQVGGLSDTQRLEILTDISLATTDESIRTSVEAEIARIENNLAIEADRQSGDTEVPVDIEVVPGEVDNSQVEEAIDEAVNNTGDSGGETPRQATADVVINPVEAQGQFDTGTITSAEDVQQLEADLESATAAVTDFQTLLLTLPTDLQPGLDALIAFNDTGLVPLTTSLRDFAFLLIEPVPVALLATTNAVVKVNGQIKGLTEALTAGATVATSFGVIMTAAFNKAGASAQLFSDRAINSLEAIRQGMIGVIAQAQELVKELANAAASAGDLSNAIPGAGNGGGGNTGGRKFGGPVKAGEIYQFLEPGLPFEIFRAQGRNYFLSGTDGEFLSPFASGNKQSLPGTGLETQPPRPDLLGRGASSNLNFSGGDVNITVNVPQGIDANAIAPQIAQEVSRVLADRDNNFRRNLRTAGKSG